MNTGEMRKKEIIRGGLVEETRRRTEMMKSGRLKNTEGKSFTSTLRCSVFLPSPVIFFFFVVLLTIDEFVTTIVASFLTTTFGLERSQE